MHRNTKMSKEEMKPNKCQHAAGLRLTGLSEWKEREINNNRQCNSHYRTKYDVKGESQRGAKELFYFEDACILLW